MTAKHKASSGITLLELMIATGILVVAISGLLAIFIGFFSLNENARKVTLALIASQDKMEEILSSSFDTIYSTYNGINFNPAGFPSSEAKGAIYIDNTNPDLLELCVSVSWREIAGRVIGEDTNLNGSLDTGEDLNVNGRIDSPVEIVTLIVER